MSIFDVFKKKAEPIYEDYEQKFIKFRNANRDIFNLIEQNHFYNSSAVLSEHFDEKWSEYVLMQVTTTDSTTGIKIKVTESGSYYRGSYEISSAKQLYELGHIPHSSDKIAFIDYIGGKIRIRW